MTSEIHPGCVIGDDVVVGDRCILHANVTVMAGSRIGNDCTLFPSATLYEETQVGDRVIIHASAVIGAYGFGYEMIEGKHTMLPQLGNVVIESDVEIGSGTTIDRGTYDSERRRRRHQNRQPSHDWPQLSYRTSQFVVCSRRDRRQLYDW